MPNMLPRSKGLLVLITAVLTGLLPAVAQKYHPIAATKPANGSLFVLASEGTVFAISLGPTSGQIVGRFNFALNGLASDMTYGVVGSQGVLFIGSSSATGQIIQGRVQEFTTDGRLLNTWTINHIVAGMTFDQNKQMVYFVSGDSPEIFAINPNSPKNGAVNVTGVNGATKLGPLTIDAASRNFYVADSNQGAVLGVDTQTHKTFPLGHLATPQALLLSNDQSQLIVADLSKRQIFAITLGTLPTTRAVTTPKSFLEPDALAWWDATHLVVGDSNAGTVVVLAAAGSNFTIQYSLTLQ